jgi:LuxR family maltose regulon positive regulatory protein
MNLPMTPNALSMPTAVSTAIAASAVPVHQRRVPLDCLARLQRAFDAGPAAAVPGPAATAAVPGIVEPLTGRELEVLEMLAAGRSNQAIASQLFVSLDTVKKHVGHVLGKLGAANRTEAVARARQLGMIP